MTTDQILIGIALTLVLAVGCQEPRRRTAAPTVGAVVVASREVVWLVGGPQLVGVVLGAAVAEMGHERHELHGSIAFASWLGVHTWLMSGVRGRIDAFVSWGWDYFSGNRMPGLVDHPLRRDHRLEPAG